MNKSYIKMIVFTKNNIAIPNEDFECDDNENDSDETFLAKFLLREIIYNKNLFNYMDELGFYNEDDIKYLEKDDWICIYLFLTNNKLQNDLVNMLKNLTKPIFINNQAEQQV